MRRSRKLNMALPRAAARPATEPCPRRDRPILTQNTQRPAGPGPQSPAPKPGPHPQAQAPKPAASGKPQQHDHHDHH